MFAVLFILVTTGILTIGRLLAMARRDADWFGGASAALTAILAFSVCTFTGWLLLSRQVTETGIEDSFSFVLFSATIWVFAFLVPKAIRERDLFGFVCAIIAAVLALAAWLLIGIGVGSTRRSPANSSRTHVIKTRAVHTPARRPEFKELSAFMRRERITADRGRRPRRAQHPTNRCVAATAILPPLTRVGAVKAVAVILLLDRRRALRALIEGIFRESGAF